jgi:hypothetical protein
MRWGFGLGLLWLLFAGGTAFAERPTEAFDPYKGPAPVLVLEEHWPMESVDLPLFILYEDRTVIFAEPGAQDAYTFQTRRLDQRSVDKIIAKARELCACTRLVQSTSSGGDDAHTFRVFVQLENAVGASQGPATAEGLTSDGLMHLFIALLKFVPDKGKRWEPAYIRLLLRPGQNRHRKPAPWPANWPSLKSRYAQPHGDGGYVVYLPGDQLGTLRKLQWSAGGPEAVRVDGEPYRFKHSYVFPNNPIWRTALRRATWKGERR